VEIFDVLVVPTTARHAHDCRRETVRSLYDLQRLVGGMVEAVDLPGRNGLVMWADEEGIIKGSPVNELATTIVDTYARERGFVLGQTFHGDVAFCGYEPVGGEKDVPDSFVNFIIDNFGEQVQR
jgi:hypothetical protein